MSVDPLAERVTVPQLEERLAAEARFGLGHGCEREDRAHRGFPFPFGLRISQKLRDGPGCRAPSRELALDDRGSEELDVIVLRRR